jgi:hypothetical protein
MLKTHRRWNGRGVSSRIMWVHPPSWVLAQSVVMDWITLHGVVHCHGNGDHWIHVMRSETHSLKLICDIIHRIGTWNVIFSTCVPIVSAP